MPSFGGSYAGEDEVVRSLFRAVEKAAPRFWHGETQYELHGIYLDERGEITIRVEEIS